jgi:hypothetical protein
MERYVIPMLTFVEDDFFEEECGDDEPAFCSEDEEWPAEGEWMCETECYCEDDIQSELVDRYVSYDGEFIDMDFVSVELEPPTTPDESVVLDIASDISEDRAGAVSILSGKLMLWILILLIAVLGMVFIIG